MEFVGEFHWLFLWFCLIICFFFFDGDFFFGGFLLSSMELVNCPFSSLDHPVIEYVDFELKSLASSDSCWKALIFMTFLRNNLNYRWKWLELFWSVGNYNGFVCDFVSFCLFWLAAFLKFSVVVLALFIILLSGCLGQVLMCVWILSICVTILIVNHWFLECIEQIWTIES